MADWRDLVPGFVWRLAGVDPDVPDIPPGRAQVPDTEVGTMGPTDWLSQPIAVGSLITYPADGPGSSPQMTLARVVELRTDGMTVDVIRRSRTGKPNGQWERTRVRLGSVGIANSTVFPEEEALYG